jgi:general secretion pathway protein L
VEISSTALIKCFFYYKKQLDAGKYILIHLGKERGELITIDAKRLIYSRAFHASSDEKVDVLSAELNRTLISQNWIKDDINEIVLIGDFDDYQEEMLQDFKDKIQCNTTFLDISSSKGKNREEDSQYLMAFSLALRGIENDSPPVNLLPPVEEVRKERKWYVAALPLLILVLLLGVGVLVSPLIQGKEVITVMTKEIEKLEVQAREMEKVENEVQELSMKIDQLMSIRTDGFDALKIVKELTEIIPSDTWITDIRYKEDKIELAGYSTAASSLIPILDNSPLFTEVEFSAPVTTTGRRGERLINDRGSSRRSASSLNRTVSKPKQAKTDGMEQFKIKAILEERR